MDRDNEGLPNSYKFLGLKVEMINPPTLRGDGVEWTAPVLVCIVEISILAVFVAVLPDPLSEKPWRLVLSTVARRADKPASGRNPTLGARA